MFLKLNKHFNKITKKKLSILKIETGFTSLILLFFLLGLYVHSEAILFLVSPLLTAVYFIILRIFFHHIKLFWIIFQTLIFSLFTDIFLLPAFEVVVFHGSGFQLNLLAILAFVLIETSFEEVVEILE